MPAVETKIWMAMRDAVTGAASTTFNWSESSGPLAVAWPGDDYKPTDEPYLSVSGVPVPPSRQLVGEGKPHDRTGTLAMVLRVPLAGLTYEVALNNAGLIAAEFSDSRRMKFEDVCVKIPSRAEVGGGFRDGSWWHIPINVPWQVFA